MKVIFKAFVFETLHDLGDVGPNGNHMIALKVRVEIIEGNFYLEDKSLPKIVGKSLA